MGVRRKPSNMRNVPMREYVVPLGPNEFCEIKPFVEVLSFRAAAGCVNTDFCPSQPGKLVAIRWKCIDLDGKRLLPHNAKLCKLWFGNVYQFIAGGDPNLNIGVRSPLRPAHLPILMPDSHVRTEWNLIQAAELNIEFYVDYVVRSEPPTGRVCFECPRDDEHEHCLECGSTEHQFDKCPEFPRAGLDTALHHCGECGEPGHSTHECDILRQLGPLPNGLQLLGLTPQPKGWHCSDCSVTAFHRHCTECGATDHLADECDMEG